MEATHGDRGRAEGAQSAGAQNVGDELRRLRKDRGLSQENLADRLRVSRPVIAKIETGRQVPDEKLLRDLERCLGPQTRLRELAEAARSSGRPYRPPRNTSIQVDWLERFEQCFRVTIPVGSLANDLRAAHIKRLEGDRAGALESLGYALYHFTRFRQEIETFVREWGGLWILLDAEHEQASADAAYLVWYLAPLNERDDSWLRLMLSRLEQREMDPFLEVIEESDRGQQLLAKWTRWFDSCRCRTQRPRPTCKFHSVISQSEIFGKAIDDDWDLVADWYRKVPDRVYIEDSLLEQRLGQATELAAKGATGPSKSRHLRARGSKVKHRPDEDAGN
jgi:transcriptional regulator with XRE-family HTH domain